MTADVDYIPLFIGLVLITVSTAISGVLLLWKQHAEVERRLTVIETTCKILTGGKK
jgi:hypothetical protein